MKRFTTIDQSRPQKRSALQRKSDFGEISPVFEDGAAAEQSSRCSQCGIPMCQVHCPLGNNIPDWLNAAAKGHWHEAWEYVTETNAFPEVCGRVCPQDRLCEGHCVIEADFDSVTIGSIEAKITEKAFESGWVLPIQPDTERAQKIAIIGAGPGGMAAAIRLRGYGYQVDIFDRQEQAGGLMTFGIPDFKLDKKLIHRRVDWLKQSGVRFYLNHEIGRDQTFAQLRQRYEAVIIATGVYRPFQLDFLKGAGIPVFRAFDFLKSNNLDRQGMAPIDPRHVKLGGLRVGVIGGGDTAMDCVRTCVRRGAKQVTCLYRRDRANMPGSAREVKLAEEEGVEFRFLSQPVDFDDGLVIQPQELGPEDGSGRRQPQAAKVPAETLEFDVLIEALGFSPENIPQMFGQPELQVDSSGRLQTSDFSTALPGVYAIGDIVRGASLVVWAIRDGQDCAESIHNQWVSWSN